MTRLRLTLAAMLALTLLRTPVTLLTTLLLPDAAVAPVTIALLPSRENLFIMLFIVMLPFLIDNIYLCEYYYIASFGLATAIIVYRNIIIVTSGVKICRYCRVRTP